MSNITEISKPTQWKPGQSGNLNGRPVGTRQAFSAGFLRDLAEVWSEEGRETMVKTARTLRLPCNTCRDNSEYQWKHWAGACLILMWKLAAKRSRSQRTAQ